MRRKIYLFTTLKLVTLVILVVTGIVGSIWLSQHQPQASLVFTNKVPEQNTVLQRVAYVSGEVTKPGVYQVSTQTRVTELITMAGGLTKEADLEYVNTQLNLAKFVEDEQHIFIPAKTETTANSATANTSNRININTATATELDTLPGIGPSTADAIIQGRPYKSVDDLLNVSGIGDAKLAKIRDLIEI